MSLKLAARLVPLIPVKILDLQENDTTDHTEDLAAFVPPGCVAVLLQPRLIVGTGVFRFYSVSCTDYITLDSANLNLCPIKDRELKWKNSVANDDWDIFLFGYFVQKRTR